jgi:hypothetical protein
LQISILTPDFDTTEIDELLNSSCFTIDEFAIADILNTSLIQGYLNAGEFYCSSTPNESIEFNVHNKRLTLKLDKDTYYSINAVHLTNYQQKKPQTNSQQFIFEIDLSCCTDMDLKKLRYELQNGNFDKIAVNFSWFPSDKNVCASSIGKFFNDMDYEIKTSNFKNINELKFTSQFPALPTLINDNGNDDDDDWQKFIECIGMIILQCDIEHNSCSSYQLPDNMIEIGKSRILHCKGFLTTRIIKSLIEKISFTVKSNTTFPYIVLSCISSNSSNHTKMLFITSEKLFVAE